MAERYRSRDGRKETDEIMGARGTISQQGRGGGRLARGIGSKDELKRARQRPAGKTRATGSMKKGGGNDD